MSYFGGLGAGKGWHKTHFLLEAQELSELLSQRTLTLVRTNGWVPRDYVETSPDEYVNSYRRYLEQLCANSWLGRTAVGDLDISLTTTREILVEDDCNDPGHKLLRPREPVISLSELSIVCTGDRVLVNVMSRDPGYLGLSMSFPKFVSFDAEGHEWLHPTDRFANHTLHEQLRAAVMERTGPLTLHSDQKRQRTQVRVSKRCKAWLNEHAYLRRHGLTVV